MCAGGGHGRAEAAPGFPSFCFLFFPLFLAFSPVAARDGPAPPCSSAKLCNAGSQRCRPTCVRPRPAGGCPSPPLRGPGSPRCRRGGVPASAEGAAPGARRGRPGSLRPFLPSAFICCFLPPRPAAASRTGGCRVPCVNPRFCRKPPQPRDGPRRCPVPGCRRRPPARVPALSLFLFPFITLIRF